MPLTFKDIGDWSPASISIVDQPSHPLAIFEVYEDDDEFIRKYKHIEVNNMSENNDEVKMPSSVFERVFGPVIMKSKEEPDEELESVKEELAQAKEEIVTLQETIKTLEEQLKEKESEDKPSGDEGKEPVNIEEVVDKAIKKYMEAQEEDEEDEDDSESDEENNGDNDEEEDIVDDEKFIKKSKSLDLDNLKRSKSEKTFMERIGRSNDGMKW